MLRIAIMASGSGSNAQAIIDKVKAGILQAEIGLIFSNSPSAYVLERAKEAGIPYKTLDHRNWRKREEFDSSVDEVITAAACDLIVLAGYMRLLSHSFVKRWRSRIINIHPALLPSFPGAHGAKDALAYGVLLTGTSVHFVEEVMDSGPLIIQGAIPVLPNDTPESLQKRIQAIEHRIYPQAIQWLATGRIRLNGRKVCLHPSDRPLAQPPSESLVWPPLEQGF